MGSLRAMDLLQSELASLQRHMADVFQGHERLAILEICRTLDAIFAVEKSLGSAEEDHAHDHYYARCGVPEALEPFLDVAGEWSPGYLCLPSNGERTSLIRSYLVECGRLVDLTRLVKLRPYGLATVSICAGDIEIIVKSDSPERIAPQLRRDITRAKASRNEMRPSEQIMARMLSNVWHDELLSIRYEVDSEIEKQFLELAATRREFFPESEAFPGDCNIGGRAFSEWRKECERAHARVIRHIEFAKLLCVKRRQSNPRDLLTMIFKRADVAQAIERDGTPREFVDATLRALTTTFDDLRDYSQIFEPPATPYISLDKEHLIAPCYGMLCNPYFSMFRHLRRTYRSDWDRAVDAREVAFRKDIKDLFPSPRYTVLESGYRIKRADGSHLTDIDAIVFDSKKGQIALMQLKWHDPYGRSIAERESRRKNLLGASEWVLRVQEWVSGRDCKTISATLGLPAGRSGAAPQIYVVSRYASRFVADDRAELDATWLSWPELSHAVARYSIDPIRQVVSWVRRQRTINVRKKDFTQTHQFSNFRVMVHAQLDVLDVNN